MVDAVSETENEIEHLVIEFLIYFLRDVVQIDRKHLIYIHSLLLFIAQRSIVPVEVVFIIWVNIVHLSHRLMLLLCGMNLLFPIDNLIDVLKHVALSDLIRPQLVVIAVNFLKTVHRVCLSLSFLSREKFIRGRVDLALLIFARSAPSPIVEGAQDGLSFYPIVVLELCVRVEGRITQVGLVALIALKTSAVLIVPFPAAVFG